MSFITGCIYFAEQVNPMHNISDSRHGLMNLITPELPIITSVFQSRSQKVSYLFPSHSLQNWLNTKAWYQILTIVISNYCCKFNFNIILPCVWFPSWFSCKDATSL